MPDIREIVLARLKERDLSHYWLVQEMVKRGFARATIYKWLSGHTYKPGAEPHRISDDAAGAVLDLLDLKIVKGEAVKKARQTKESPCRKK